MPKLNEYLGGLVSEIASARKMADLQTVQIAREYAKDDMLKHFSIPRMKVSSVDLTIPFAQAGASAKMSFKEFIYDEITSVAKADYDLSDDTNDKILKDYLYSLEPDYNKIVLSIQSDEKKYTDTTAVYRLDTQTQSSIVAEDHPLIKSGTFDAISKQILAFCGNNFMWMRTTDENLFFQSIRNRMIVEYENSIKNTTSTSEVIVEASQLMKIDPKYLIYAKMTITESGMEWSKYENIDGDIVETLIPE